MVGVAVELPVWLAEGVGAPLPLGVGDRVAACVGVAAPEAVKVPVVEAGWLPLVVGVGELVGLPEVLVVAVCVPITNDTCWEGVADNVVDIDDVPA